MKDKLSNIKTTKGFTLVELMIAITAAAVLVLIISLILTMAFHSWRMNNAFADIRRDLSFSFDMIARDVRESYYDGLTVGSSALTVQSAVTAKTSVFSQTGDSLVLSTDAGELALIPEGVEEFSAVKSDDGVLIRLVINNTSHAISVTNQVFVNTRN